MTRAKTCTPWNAIRERYGRRIPSDAMDTISRVSRGPTRSSCTQRPETPRFVVLSGITKQFRSRPGHNLASPDFPLAIRPLLERLWPLFPKINLFTCNSSTNKAPNRLANTHWRINIRSDASCGEKRGNYTICNNYTLYSFTLLLEKTK